MVNVLRSWFDRLTTNGGLNRRFSMKEWSRRNIGPAELRRIEAAVFEHQDLFKEKWHEFFHR